MNRFLSQISLIFIFFTACSQQGTLDRSVLEHPNRPDTEKAQDAARQCIVVNDCFGIEPGMTVAD